MSGESTPPKELRERFMSLFWPHVDALYGAAWHMTGRADRAEDSVQETLFRAWNYFHTFSDDGNPRPWLLSILRNVVYDASRRRKREGGRVSLSDLGNDVAAAAPADPAGKIVEQEVRQAIEGLPPEFRDVVLLAVVEGLKYREVAAALEIPVGTVMSRLFRGRQLLRERLGSYADEPEDVPGAGRGGGA